MCTYKLRTFPFALDNCLGESNDAMLPFSRPIEDWYKQRRSQDFVKGVPTLLGAQVTPTKDQKVFGFGPLFLEGPKIVLFFPKELMSR